MSKIDVEKSSKLENRDFYPATAACKTAVVFRTVK